MKIHKNIIWCVTWIILLLQLDILGGIIPFLGGSIAWKVGMLLVVFDSIYAILTLSKNGLLSKYKALNTYIIIYTVCLFGISFYTVHEGVASVDHTIMYARYYFSAFLVYPFLYLEQRYEENPFMESWLPVAAIALCFRMLNCLSYDAVGTALFPTLIAGQVRGGHSTSICGAIENIFLLYAFYKMLKCPKGLSKIKIKYLIFVIIGLVYSIRFVGSRIMISALIGSMAILWYGRQKRGQKKIIAFAIAVIAIAIFAQTPFYNDLLQTVQGASASDIKNGVYDNTMSVRVYSLELLRRNWNGKPMGLAFYGTQAFKRYFTIGSNDDLGYLGNWYTMGWYCVPMIVLLLAGYFYTSIRNFGKNNAEMLYSLTIYLLITGLSLSCMDVARIDVVPFLLFILQTWKWDRDVMEELEYDG